MNGYGIRELTGPDGFACIEVLNLQGQVVAIFHDLSFANQVLPDKILGTTRPSGATSSSDDEAMP